MNAVAEYSTVGSLRLDVAIIGGGFAGTMAAVNIARLATRPLTIALYDRSGAFGRGAAYSPQSDNCILNVRAKAMGAFPDAEDDFLVWLRATGFGAADPDVGERFLPRRLYGDYLCALLAGAASGNATVERRSASVTAIDTTDDGYALTVAGRTVMARSVILALGNLPPCGFGGATLAAALARHARNPWQVIAEEQLDRNADIFIIGTGLSALDILLELAANGHRGRVTMLSRNGRFPLAHQAASECADVPVLAGNPRAVVRTVRALVREGVARGCSWQAIVDGLRSQTNRLWQSWSVAEQRQFDRHLGALWAVHRHRAPAETLAVRDALAAAGRLYVKRGRLTQLERTGEKLTVGFVERGATAATAVRTDLVIDCSGPPRDLKGSGDPLIEALFERGLVRAAPFGVGFAALSDGRVHRTSSGAAIYALGTPLRGMLCESSAVREIRQQARTVALAVCTDAVVNPLPPTIIEEQPAYLR